MFTAETQRHREIRDWLVARIECFVSLAAAPL